MAGTCAEVPAAWRSLYSRFGAGNDTLWIYQGSREVFRSQAAGIMPLMEYLERFSENWGEITVFDKVLGNAAALLALKAGCTLALSPLGSQLAVETLDAHRVEYYIASVVPHIQQANSDEVCPMESLSVGREPEDLYEAVKRLLHTGKKRDLACPSPAESRPG